MANMMKTLMNEFDALNREARVASDFGRMQTFEWGESMANNCHGMTSMETIEHLRDLFVSARHPKYLGRFNLSAVDDMTALLDLYEEMITTN